MYYRRKCRFCNKRATERHETESIIKIYTCGNPECMKKGQKEAEKYQR